MIPAFPTGSMDGDRICFNVSIIDDEAFEKDHFFLIIISSPEDNVEATPVSTLNVTIIDNESKWLFYVTWLW